jgi:hypothetical protein
VQKKALDHVAFVSDHRFDLEIVIVTIHFFLFRFFILFRKCYLFS